MSLVTKPSGVPRTLFVVDPDARTENTWDATDSLVTIGDIRSDERIYEYRLVAVHKPPGPCRYLREEIEQ